MAVPAKYATASPAKSCVIARPVKNATEDEELKKKIFLAQSRKGAKVKLLKIFATERTKNILLSLSVYFGVRHYFMWDVNKDIVVLRELCGKDFKGF